MSDAVLGADVGGTFTDVVAWDGATLTTGKTSSAWCRMPTTTAS
jgi:N-methylhydantoinase A/oxoprolinase/acetone carboxylase beta subunit